MHKFLVYHFEAGYKTTAEDSPSDQEQMESIATHRCRRTTKARCIHFTWMFYNFLYWENRWGAVEKHLCRHGAQHHVHAVHKSGKEQKERTGRKECKELPENLSPTGNQSLAPVSEEYRGKTENQFAWHRQQTGPLSWCSQPEFIPLVVQKLRWDQVTSFLVVHSLISW